MSSSFIDMGSNPEEFFSLRWNSYGKVLIESTANLPSNSKFHSVTLACEGKTIRCHRFIFAMFSPCFAQMLEEHPSSDPVIYLGNGIRFHILKTLVLYMYSGEVQVDQSVLTELLKAAEDLKIRGLTTSSSKPKPRTDATDSEEVMVNDDQGNFRGMDLTRNSGLSVNNDLARTPLYFYSRRDEEQEQGPQNTVLGIEEVKYGLGQETGLEESNSIVSVGVNVDNGLAGNDNIPEVNDDNPPGTNGISSGGVEELSKPMDEVGSDPRKSRTKRQAVLKTLQKAKQSTSKAILESDKKAKKQRTLKPATETSFYGKIMKQALGRVTASEKISKIATEIGIPVSTLCKYVKYPEKLQTSRMYAYVPDEEKKVG